jgi:uncharacterized membrane protein
VADEMSGVRARRRRVLVQPPPMQINTGRIVLAGTALWFVAFVVLLPFYTWLGHHHHRIWLWTCLAGWLLGCVGYALIGRHRSMGRTP